MPTESTVRAWFSKDEKQKYEIVFEKMENVPMQVVFASSEEVNVANASNLVDGNPNTIWHSTYGVTVAKYPHWVDFDMGKETSIKGFSYTQRSDNWNGKVKDYQIQISIDGKDWSTPVLSGKLKDHSQPQRLLLEKPVKTRFIRFTALSEHYGQDFASGAEFSVIAE